MRVRVLFCLFTSSHAYTTLCLGVCVLGGGQSLTSLPRVFSLLFPQTAKIDSCGEEYPMCMPDLSLQLGSGEIISLDSSEHLYPRESGSFPYNPTHTYM